MTTKLALTPEVLKKLVLIQKAKALRRVPKPPMVDGHAVENVKTLKKISADLTKFVRGFFKRPVPPPAPKVPVSPPVGREISLAKIIARLRAKSPKHATRLQEMLAKRGLKNTANEMESGGFKAVPGMDVTKNAAEKLAMRIQSLRAALAKGPKLQQLLGYKPSLFEMLREQLKRGRPLEVLPNTLGKQQLHLSGTTHSAPFNTAGIKKLQAVLAGKPKPAGLHGVPHGHGTAAFRFGD